MIDKSAYLVDNVIKPGEKDSRFVAGWYTILKESEYFYTISNGHTEIKLHKGRFKHEAPGPIEHLVTYTVDQMESIVTKHKKGYAVTVKDLDAGVWLPDVRIWTTIEQADIYAMYQVGYIGESKIV